MVIRHWFMDTSGGLAPPTSCRGERGGRERWRVSERERERGRERGREIESDGESERDIESQRERKR